MIAGDRKKVSQKTKNQSQESFTADMILILSGNLQRSWESHRQHTGKIRFRIRLTRENRYGNCKMQTKQYNVLVINDIFVSEMSKKANGSFYNDNFTLNVLDLTHIYLATEKDKAYKIDYWAKLFKAKTWEDKSPEVIKNVGTEKTMR